MKQTQAERIIMGIDPGTQVMGYGLLKAEGPQLTMLCYGVIHLKKYTNQAIKLRKISERTTELIREYHPDEMALEAPFYGKNVQVALKLGRAQGVAMAAALVQDIPIREYAPRAIKQSVTGRGDASKEQVAAMLKQILRFEDEHALLDATDALAVAVCHFFQSGTARPKATGWAILCRPIPSEFCKKTKKVQSPK
ncbi:MAG: crossover junction endodeoxyribonuclease RuvC [Microscillaceae bacterium]|nr:crossover junction endodeoxyribonuclease RuvC [Microscillaceae bacterium]